VVSKAKLMEAICAEFRLAQSPDAKQWQPPGTGEISFPPVLPVGDGKHLNATDNLLMSVQSYADLLRQESTVLRAALSAKEFAKVVRLAFGQVFHKLGTADPEPDDLGEEVTTTINLEIATRKRDGVLQVGCWLIEAEGGYPVVIGPVTFSRRLEWLERQRRAQAFSVVTLRRLHRRWSGEQVGDRKSGRGEFDETAIAEAVGRCPIICEVRTHGLSTDLVVQKGLLAARLALTTLALGWANPQSALKNMNLIYDGSPRSRRYAILNSAQVVASGVSTISPPFGQHIEGSLSDLLKTFCPTFDIVAEALHAYVNPHSQVKRPSISNSIFLCVWWFHQGCRETSDQMAVTAFAASLDALASGGKAGGIRRLITARLGITDHNPLMKDGRKTQEVVEAIYNAARSRFIHGSSVDYVEDWSDLRATASVLARLLLLEVTFWLHEQPHVMSLKAAQK
jgi:hypothetical protein